MAFFDINTPQLPPRSLITESRKGDGEHTLKVLTSIPSTENGSSLKFGKENQLDEMSNNAFDDEVINVIKKKFSCDQRPIEFKLVEYPDSTDLNLSDKSSEEKHSDLNLKQDYDLHSIKTHLNTSDQDDQKFGDKHISNYSSDEIMLMNAQEPNEYNSDDSPQFTYENLYQETNNNEKINTEDKVKGVCYCPSDRSWTAWWTDQGRNRKKAFKVSLYGCDEARKMAIEYRQNIEKQIPELRTNRSERKFKNINDLDNLGGTKSIESSPIQQPICDKSLASQENSLNPKSSPKYNLRGVIKAPPKLTDEFSLTTNNLKSITSPNEKVHGAISPFASFHLSNDPNLSPKEELSDQSEYSDLHDSPMDTNQQSPQITNKYPSNSPYETPNKKIEESPEDLYTHNSSPNSQGIYFNRARQTIVAFIKTPQGKKYKTFSTRQYGTVLAARSMAIKWRESMLEQHQNEEDTNKETSKKSNQRIRTQNSPTTKNLIRGISYSSVNKAWCTQWCNSTGVACLKSFSVSKYGDDGAKKKAMEQRQKLELSGQVGSRIPGVVFQDNAWKSSWLDNSGEEQTVTFKVGKDGMSYDCARRLAIACRKQRRKLNTLPIQEIGSPKKSFELTPDLNPTGTDSLDDFTLDSKSRKMSSPNFNDNYKVTSKRYRKTPYQTSQPTPLFTPIYDTKNEISTRHSDQCKQQSSQNETPQQSNIYFSPFILNSVSPDLPIQFSDIPRGINYDRTKLAFYITYYNENNKFTTKHFPIRTGYNLAKQMAIMFVHELDRKGLVIQHPSPSTRQQSITPATIMNNYTNLSPSSFTLDDVQSYVTEENKNDLSFSLLGKALVDNYKSNSSKPSNLTYSSMSTKCSSAQDSSNDNTQLSKSYIKDNKFEYINSLNLHQEISNNTNNETSSTHNSLLHRIKGLKRNDEDNNNNGQAININNISTAVTSE